MKRKRRQQVHPAASAMIILLVLGGVNWTWWRFLVYRAGGGAGGPSPGAAPSSAPVQRIAGRADVSVITLAGDPEPGEADGPAHAGRFDRPTGVALDAAGNVVVADTGNNRIRIVSPSGDTSTLAGSDAGYADGSLAEARFNAPCAVAVARDNGIYVADTGNRCIRLIKNGRVSTIGGSPSALGPGPRLVTAIAIAGGAKPELVAAHASGRLLERLSLGGASLGTVAVPGPPAGVSGQSMAAAVPSAGALVIDGAIMRNVLIHATDVAADPRLPSVAIKHPLGLCPLGKGWLVTDRDHSGVMLVKSGSAQVLAGVVSSAGKMSGYRDGDGIAAMFGALTGIASDGKRFVYVADTGNNCIRRLDISELASH